MSAEATSEKPKSKGVEEAEKALMAMMERGTRSEMELKALGAPLPEGAGGELAPVDEVEDEATEPAIVGLAAKRRFGMPDTTPQVEERLSKKISPSVRPSVWMGVRKLNLRLEEVGDQTDLNHLVDAALATMVREMNRGLDGISSPDPEDLAREAGALLKSIMRSGLTTENAERADDLVRRIEDL